MAYTSRPPPTGTSFRQPSNLHQGISQQQSSALNARIAAKRAELESLKQLRDLSGALATNIQALESKLSTLKDGTEAVACVLANWDNVLRAISMASSELDPGNGNTKAATLNASTHENSMAGDSSNKPNDLGLPSTLVRIPAEQSDHSNGR